MILSRPYVNVPVLSMTGPFFEVVQECSNAPMTMERSPRSGSGKDEASSSLQASIWAAKNFSTSARVPRGKRSDGDAITPEFEIGRRATGLRIEIWFLWGAKNESKKPRHTCTSSRRNDALILEGLPFSNY